MHGLGCSSIVCSYQITGPYLRVLPANAQADIAVLLLHSWACFTADDDHRLHVAYVMFAAFCHLKVSRCGDSCVPKHAGTRICCCDVLWLLTLHDRGVALHWAICMCDDPMVVLWLVCVCLGAQLQCCCMLQCCCWCCCADDYEDAHVV
jgi:hypothetical protein